MSPDDVEEEPASSMGDFGWPTQGHSTKHRRGKTGRSRKKRRHWKYFSRWRASDSDDDDDIDLYQWSKARGLTSRTLPPTPVQPTKPSIQQTRSKVSSDFQESRSAVVLRTQRNLEVLKRTPSANDISTMQEAIFLTKLCASIIDKKSFVSQSSDVAKNAEQKKVVEVLDRKNEQRSSIATPKKALVRVRSANNPKKAKELESVVEKAKRTSSLPVIESSPRLPGEQNDSEKNKESEVEGNYKEPLQIKRLLSPRKGSATCSIKSAPSPKKEWSANVESDILRLYETSEPVQTSNLVCSWAPTSQANNVREDPSPTSNVVQVIEKKIEKAEHTPTYVQVLAKMFKSRMQLRKERERMESDMKKSRQRKDAIPPEKTESATEGDERLPDTETSNHAAPTLMSFAHLRYRHLNDDVPSFGVERRRKQGFSITDNYQDRGDAVLRHRITTQPNFKSYNQDISSIQTRAGASENTITNVAQEGRREMDSFSLRLEQETRSIAKDAPYFKLNVTSDVSRLYKPPSLQATLGHENPDPNSPQALSRKVRQCLLSNSRLKYGERERKNGLVKTSNGAEVLTRVVATNPRHKSEVQVRWPASVGSLYFRPPAKIYHKDSVQKA